MKKKDAAAVVPGTFLSASVTLEQVNKIRRYHGLTYESLSRKAGITLWATWAVFRRRTFDLRKIAAICRALDIPLSAVDLSSFIRMNQETAPREETSAAA
jgi:hypothetical protein